MRAAVVAAALTAACLTTALVPTAAFAAAPSPYAPPAATSTAATANSTSADGATSTNSTSADGATSTNSTSAGSATVTTRAISASAPAATTSAATPAISASAAAATVTTRAVSGAHTDTPAPTPGAAPDEATTPFAGEPVPPVDSPPTPEADPAAGTPAAPPTPPTQGPAADSTDSAEGTTEGTAAPPAPLDPAASDHAPPTATPEPAPPTTAAEVAATIPPPSPTPLPASTWAATTAPAPGQVLVQTDPAAVDYAVDIAWAPPASVTPLGYRVELFSGRSVSNTATLIARAEVDATATRYRIEGVGFGATTVTARVTLIDGASALPDALVSESVTLPAASAGALSLSRAGTPTLSAPTADGFTVTWDAASGDPAPAGYAVRILERRHDQAATSANSFVTTTLDVGATTSAVVTGLEGSSRYLAGVVAYDLVDGVKRFRPSSATSTVPAWSADYVAQTLGERAPTTEWSNPPAAPTADSARSLTWQGAPTTGRYTGGSAVTGYRIDLFTPGAGLVATSEISVDDRDSAPATRFGGLTPGTAYSVRVAAINATGVGERSDFSPLVTTPTGSSPGSRPPAYADRAALQTAISAGIVADATATVGGPVTVDQGQDATVTVPWTGIQSGEAWWYGDATFATTVSTGGASESASARPSLTVSTKGLGPGTHYLLFVSDSELDGGAAPAGAEATVVTVDVVGGGAGGGILTLDDAVLRWGLNDETNNGAYFGGCNYLSAGRTPDPGGSAVFGPAQYAESAGNVTIEKPDASGRYVRASWTTKCLDRTGATLSSGTATPYGGNQFVMTGGAGRVDPATGTATIRWTGDVTVVYYGGLSFWYLSDPVLTVENGTGTLTATVGGFGTDMDDLATWVPLADRTVTLAVFSGAQVGADGFTVTPDYRGVTVALPPGQTAQARSGPDWGSFPQSFVDFHLESGQAAYWYSSGGQADAAKAAQPFTVGYDAATFAAPTAPPETAVKASARVPAGKLPPPRLPAAAVLSALPVATEAVTTDARSSSVVIVESATSAALGDDVILLLAALIALLGLVVVIAGAGGGLVLLGATSRRL
ncbi:Htaa protein [Herbiconiux ginsengi]|uniref:Htaa protein n=2 Tax=Herbiconiux ginsengi TaxID=381665 RepID=A0A1H3N1I8_9MICO|nr:Htaa protein [Herbiconiux ginsengi]